MRPTKYLSLNQCALRVAALLLDEIRAVLAIRIREIEDLVTSKLGHGALANMLTAINTLYLLGLVRYDKVLDALVYIPPRDRNEM